MMTKGQDRISLSPEFKNNDFDTRIYVVSDTTPTKIGYMYAISYKSTENNQLSHTLDQKEG